MTAVIDHASASITLDELRERLATTEPLSEIPFDMNAGNVKVRLKDGFADNIANMKDADVLDASIKVGTREYALTKGALLEGASLMGLNQAFVTRTPASLVQPLYNYWYGNMDKKTKLLVAQGQVALAMTKDSIVPFSNLQFVDVAQAAFEKQYGRGVEIMADYKSHHDLSTTRMRLYVPASQRAISLPSGRQDMHAAGIQLANSLRGATPTSLNGYIFNFFCTNGMISTALSSGSWKRKSGQGPEVYEWAQVAIDNILGGMEHEFAQIQTLADTPVAGETNLVLADVFDTYKVPLHVRPAIIEALVDEENLTMYAILQAITATANDPTLHEGQRERVMQIGGDLPHSLAERCGTCRRIKH